MMKKKTVVILCAILAVLLIGGGVAWSFLPHPLRYDINAIEPVGSDLTVVADDGEDVTVKKNGPGEFRILLFTDLHLDGKNDTSVLTVSHLVENIQKEKPDLVLLGGDNVTSGLNGARARQLGRIFEKLGVYWAGVLGNHEGDNPYSVSRTKMAEIFSSFDHCLLRRGPEEIDGDCNYALHILDAADRHLQTFFFLDTFDEMTAEQMEAVGWQEGDSEYDGAHENQIDWFVQKTVQAKQDYGEDCSAILVQHIPLPQVAAAAETGDFLYGDKQENVCCTGYDSGLFDKVKASGIVKAVFCGHDHMNNFGVNYEGILLSYIEPSNYGSYNLGNRRGAPEEDWLQGYTLLTLHEDGTFTPKQVRNSAPDA